MLSENFSSVLNIFILTYILLFYNNLVTRFVLLQIITAHWELLLGSEQTHKEFPVGYPPKVNCMLLVVIRKGGLFMYSYYQQNKEKKDSLEEFKVRPCCKDVWNAFMAEGAKFGKCDIPICPTTATSIPNDLITWDEARQIYIKHRNKKEYNFFVDAYINWYTDDYKFDNSQGIWQNPKKALEIITHFAGIITPDFSTYQDFPEPIKLYATYRMRLFGYWLGKRGINVINNVRWGTEETYLYCFEGIPEKSIVCIGTVGGGPRKLENRERFEKGLNKMVEILHPQTILIYGSANGKCFEELKKQGIQIVSYPSKTARDFERRKHHE